MMKIILIVLGALMLIGGAGAAINNKDRKGLFGVIAVLGLIIVVASQSFVIVGTGYSGVRVTFGQIDEKPVEQGFNTKLPFVQKIVKVNNRQQDIEVVESETSIESTITGKIPITISGVNVTYQINPEKVSYIYTTVTDPKNLLTLNIVSSAIKDTTPGFDTDSVVVRSGVESATKETLQNYINDKYGTDVLTILQVTIGNISFTEEYNASVDKKNTAKQDAEAQEIINKKNIDQANAEAESKLISAQAEKEANELLEKSITENILIQQYLEKWDGRLPAVTGSDGGVMLDVSGLSNDAVVAE